MINVSSIAHTFGKINFDDLQSQKSYDSWVAYGEANADEGGGLGWRRLLLLVSAHLQWLQPH